MFRLCEGNPAFHHLTVTCTLLDADGTFGCRCRHATRSFSLQFSLPICYLKRIIYNEITNALSNNIVRRVLWPPDFSGHSIIYIYAVEFEVLTVLVMNVTNLRDIE
jgi:hypothetical protein